MALVTCSQHSKPAFGCLECSKAADQTRLSANQQQLLTKGSWRCGCPGGVPDIHQDDEEQCPRCDVRRPNIKERAVHERVGRAVWIDPKQIRLFQ